MLFHSIILSGEAWCRHDRVEYRCERVLVDSPAPCYIRKRRRHGVLPNKKRVRC